MYWATLWAIFAQTHLVTLIATLTTSRLSDHLQQGDQMRLLKNPLKM
jgi:hypothetical protein